MRNFLKVIVFCSVFFAGSLSAQTLKFGHIEFSALLAAMPERDAAKSALEKVQADLESKLQTPSNSSENWFLSNNFFARTFHV